MSGRSQFANVLRWVPFDINEKQLRNRIGNKMIRPTTIPQTLEELQVEQAIAREALRLAFIQHRKFAVGLKGVQKQRTIADAFRQQVDDSLVNMMKLDLIVGSGGVLSQAPRRVQSMRMMIDAYAPEGVTAMAVDSIFMMPHLGVLSTVNEEAATEVFEKDCIIYLGTCIAPTGPIDAQRPVLRLTYALPNGEPVDITVSAHEMLRLEYEQDIPVVATVTPLQKQLDVGGGPGRPWKGEIQWRRHLYTEAAQSNWPRIQKNGQLSFKNGYVPWAISDEWGAVSRWEQFLRLGLRSPLTQLVKIAGCPLRVMSAFSRRPQDVVARTQLRVITLSMYNQLGGANRLSGCSAEKLQEGEITQTDGFGLFR